MSKGKTTSMLGIRLPDELMDALDQMCKGAGKTRSEILIPLISRRIQAYVGTMRGPIKVPKSVSKDGWVRSGKQCQWVRDDPDGVVLREATLGQEWKVENCRLVSEEADGVRVVGLKLGAEFKVLWKDVGPPDIPGEPEKLEAKR